jgi:glycosyltransferase involved in cell wall biosynthesis
MKRLRILLLSEQNNPDWVSVPLVGYLHAAALARLHDVTLVTHDRNRPALASQAQPFREIITCSIPWADRIFAWAVDVVFKNEYGSQALTAFRLPFYWLFEWWVWRHLGPKLQAGAYDIVLRITPVAPVLPSMLCWFLRKGPVPFVIGPINGGLPWPTGFQQAERQKEWISGFRDFYRYVPFARATYRYAAAIIAGSSQTYSEYLDYHDKLFFIPENGIQSDRIAKRLPAIKKGPLELIFVGRLVPFKACDLALRAASPLIHAGRARLTVVGDGPERARLEQLCGELGIEAGVNFTGALPHPAAMQRFAAADILVFPSIREFGGGVVFEALAHGVVPIVAAYGGPGDIVYPDIGFKINLSDEAQMQVDMTAILEHLDRDREELRRLSTKGQAHALQDLSWDGKAKLTSSILCWCLGLEPKPVLLPPVLIDEKSEP